MRGDEFYDTHSCSALANVQIRFEHPCLEHYESDGAMKDLIECDDSFECFQLSVLIPRLINRHPQRSVDLSVFVPAVDARTSPFGPFDSHPNAGKQSSGPHTSTRAT